MWATANKGGKALIQVRWSWLLLASDIGSFFAAHEQARSCVPFGEIITVFSKCAFSERLIPASNSSGGITDGEVCALCVVEGETRKREGC